MGGGLAIAAAPIPPPDGLASTMGADLSLVEAFLSALPF